MAENVTPISRAISDELTGAYTKRRLTQEELARRVEMPLVTLQKKLRARAPITATDLVLLSNAIGVDPAKVLTDAMEELANAERLASEGIPTIAGQRKKRPSEMTEEELDAFEGEQAANRDPELGHPEPDPA
ncbi:helix-turn-helix domain-containing protein [Microbacterium sp. W4I20]|uniref:helix-turn-helix domain-containing protein n=1 Tax=Microbacterium sp. W4I20 TaxID=3042262 RepID=UPI00278057CB|nr:helix-turn-helix transcriptional regulator [Microbacterium sp. W4I20]MDQ0726852.1 transcriptional regulator with XRE-family HTH domain [Microbacterium sp. W4I20]